MTNTDQQKRTVTTITTPSDRETGTERVFDANGARVFQAYTDPERGADLLEAPTPEAQSPE